MVVHLYLALEQCYFCHYLQNLGFRYKIEDDETLRWFIFTNCRTLGESCGAHLRASQWYDYGLYDTISKVSSRVCRRRKVAYATNPNLKGFRMKKASITLAAKYTKQASW